MADSGLPGDPVELTKDNVRQFLQDFKVVLEEADVRRSPEYSTLQKKLIKRINRLYFRLPCDTARVVAVNVRHYAIGMSVVEWLQRGVRGARDAKLLVNFTGIGFTVVFLVVGRHNKRHPK